MASGRNGTLYTGMTANLTARVWKHRNGLLDGFTKLRLIEETNPGWLDLAADWFPENDPNWVPPEEPD